MGRNVRDKQRRIEAKRARRKVEERRSVSRNNVEWAVKRFLANMADPAAKRARHGSRGCW